MKRLCPHCHGDLPDDATFCGACGRRIEGWSKAPLAADLQAGDSAEPSDGGEGEMPTRQMDVTPEMLRKARPTDDRAAAAAAAAGAAKTSSKNGVAATGAAGGTATAAAVAPTANPTTKSKAKAKAIPAKPAAAASPAPAASSDEESHSAMMRAVKRRRTPLLVGIGVLGVAAAAGAFLLVRHTMGGDPAPPIAPTPVAAVPEPTTAPAPATPPAAATATKAGKRRRAVRLTPIEGSTADTGRKTPATTRPPVVDNGKGGGLPKKSVATDSKPLASSSSGGKGSAPAPAATGTAKKPADPYGGAHPDDLPSEATPMTEEEMKSQAEAQIDADSVRYVVKSHLSQVKACYSRAFKDSSPGGRVDLAFAIDRNGRAARVRTDANTTDSDSLSRCLEERVKEWQFPRPVGGEIELVYPFIFAAGS